MKPGGTDSGRHGRRTASIAGRETTTPRTPPTRRRWWRLVAGLLLTTLAASAARADEPSPLRFCTDPDNPPFSSASAAMPGFYVELGQAIAEASHRPFQPVWVPTYYTKRQVRQKLLTGQCDGFIGVPDDPSFMGPRLIFSKPIISLGYVLVAAPSLALDSPQDLHDLRVAVQFGSVPQTLLATRDDIQMVTVLSPEEAMQDLSEGKADAAFIWGASAGWINSSQKHDSYRVTPFNDEHLRWNAAIAFPRDQTAIRDQVDRALSGLGDSIIRLAAKYHFPGVTQEAAPSTTLKPAKETPPEPSAQADISAGHKLFNQNCAHCHGPDAVQGEQRRNLRLLQQRYGDQMPRMFMTTVTHGRINKGMPNWSGVFSEEEFQQVLSFLSSVQEPGS